MSSAALSAASDFSAAPAQLDRRAVNAWQQLGRTLDPHDPAVVRHTCAQFVSELFFKPLLAELRAGSLAAPFADGGQTEAIFGQLLDERIADTVATAQRGGLVEQLVRHLGGAAPAPAEADATVGAPDDGRAAQVSWTTRLQAQAAPEMRTDER
jgi:Rod binding domain-containing protein